MACSTLICHKCGIICSVRGIALILEQGFCRVVLAACRRIETPEQCIRTAGDQIGWKE